MLTLNSNGAKVKTAVSILSSSKSCMHTQRARAELLFFSAGISADLAQKVFSHVGGHPLNDVCKDYAGPSWFTSDL